MKKKIAPLLIGLILVLLGLICLVGVFFGEQINAFFPAWWTLIIVIPAFASVIVNKPHTFNVTFLVIGIILLLGIQGIINLKVVYVVITVTVIIAIGTACIIYYFKKTKRENNPSSVTHTDNSDNPLYHSFLTVADYRNISYNLKGLRGYSILGSLNIDLRDAQVSQDITINLNAYFGGLSFIAPDNVRVVLEKNNNVGFSLCNKNLMNTSEALPTVHIIAKTLFGGIDIK